MLPDCRLVCTGVSPRTCFFVVRHGGALMWTDLLQKYRVISNSKF